LIEKGKQKNLWAYKKVNEVKESKQEIKTELKEEKVIVDSWVPDTFNR